LFVAKKIKEGVCLQQVNVLQRIQQSSSKRFVALDPLLLHTQHSANHNTTVSSTHTTHSNHIILLERMHEKRVQQACHTPARCGYSPSKKFEQTNIENQPIDTPA
jgi:hypothetical protein